MTTVAIVPEPIPNAAPSVFCPECGYDLEPWEVHLLRAPTCGLCDAELELGLPFELRVLTAHTGG